MVIVFGGLLEMMWERERANTVFIVEKDIYSRQAITSYLSWDRGTRVLGQARTPQDMLEQLEVAQFEMQRIDVLLLDAGSYRSPQLLTEQIALVRKYMPNVSIICLGSDAEADYVQAAEAAGAAAYLMRENVGIGIAWAVRFILDTVGFVVSQDISRLYEPFRNSYVVLPARRAHPKLTHRIEQALQLCVVEGLPAELAAAEMGVSTSTVRSYVKEGYRILEANDDTIYPPQMSPAERAFLRYSSLRRKLPKVSAKAG